MAKKKQVKKLPASVRYAKKKPKTNVCPACQGTGRDSRGLPCYPCQIRKRENSNG